MIKFIKKSFDVYAMLLSTLMALLFIQIITFKFMSLEIHGYYSFTQATVVLVGLYIASLVVTYYSFYTTSGLLSLDKSDEK